MFIPIMIYYWDSSLKEFFPQKNTTIINTDNVIAISKAEDSYTIYFSTGFGPIYHAKGEALDKFYKEIVMMGSSANSNESNDLTPEEILNTHLAGKVIESVDEKPTENTIIKTTEFGEYYLILHLQDGRRLFVNPGDKIKLNNGKLVL